MLVVGIDPGKRGGLAALDAKTGEIAFLETFPLISGQLNPNALFGCLSESLKTRIDDNTPIRVYLEKVGARPGQAGKAMFTFGEGYGYLQMGMVALGIGYELVAPQVWMKTMHGGVDRSIKDTKKRSLIASLRLWPQESFKARESDRKPHDGLFEACLIAEYGRRVLLPQLFVTLSSVEA